ncbi:hypothetical protein HYFRA_00001563 [Hymenoscyphus fraxineus]|uniref:Uncharacterized protein n=1 Tax=Hymenoscyphus fraxineus TaxID=746836 RepID=A0A9N9PXS8_9HELO|nr:hypothetical protein HYFRA_00001563 [Hymenoscyphus fraxineus]
MQDTVVEQFSASSFINRHGALSAILMPSSPAKPPNNRISYFTPSNCHAKVLMRLSVNRATSDESSHKHTKYKSKSLLHLNSWWRSTKPHEPIALAGTDQRTENLAPTSPTGIALSICISQVPLKQYSQTSFVPNCRYSYQISERDINNFHSHSLSLSHFPSFTKIPELPTTRLVVQYSVHISYRLPPPPNSHLSLHCEKNEEQTLPSDSPAICQSQQGKVGHQLGTRSLVIDVETRNSSTTAVLAQKVLLRPDLDRTSDSGLEDPEAA